FCDENKIRALNDHDNNKDLPVAMRAHQKTKHETTDISETAATTTTAIAEVKTHKQQTLPFRSFFSTRTAPFFSFLLPASYAFSLFFIPAASPSLIQRAALRTAHLSALRCL